MQKTIAIDDCYDIVLNENSFNHQSIITVLRNTKIDFTQYNDSATIIFYCYVAFDSYKDSSWSKVIVIDSKLVFEYSFSSNAVSYTHLTLPTKA